MSYLDQTLTFESDKIYYHEDSNELHDRDWETIDGLK